MFEQVGCVSCHTPEIGGVAGIYSDFLLHRVVNPRDLGGGYSEVPTPRCRMGILSPTNGRHRHSGVSPTVPLTSTMGDLRRSRRPSAGIKEMRPVLPASMNLSLPPIARPSSDS